MSALTAPSSFFKPVGASAAARRRKVCNWRQFVNKSLPNDPGSQRDPAQPAAVVKRRAVQHPHGVGQGDLLHKIAGDLMRVVTGAPGPGPDRPVRKAVRPQLRNGQSLNCARHSGAGGVAQQPQQPRTAGTGLPIKTHKNHLFTLGPL